MKELGLVHIATGWFLDTATGRVSAGGLQRYVRDLARLIRDRGAEVVVWQRSATAFQRELEPGITVRGEVANEGFWGLLVLGRKISQLAGKDAFVIYANQEMALLAKNERPISINHGIWWDGDYSKVKLFLIEQIHARLVRKCGATICVDTSYINWCHSRLSGRSLWQGRLHYVPNYADCEEPAVGGVAHGEERVVLFPRRLSARRLEDDGRGAGLMIDAFDLLRRRHADVRLLFLGPGPLRVAIERRVAALGFLDRVRFAEADLDEMGGYYRAASAVVVPSLGHEGTSLSAIESMVSGRSTVVTHIGGLGNIVIPDLNGYVSDLTPESLCQEMEKALVRNPLSETELLGGVREALGKPRWDRRIIEILRSAGRNFAGPQ